MSFAKVFKTGVQNVKSVISRAIKENMNFSCQIADIKIATDDNISYPNATDVNIWLNELFSKEFQPKPLNEKALAAMVAKGITPSKQLNEILLVIIVASESHVHVGVSIPSSMNVDINELNNDFMNKRNFVAEHKDSYCLLQFESTSSIKEKDDVFTHILSVIKKRGIYVESKEEDEVYYTLDM